MNAKKFLQKVSFPKERLEYLASSLLLRSALVTVVAMPFVRATHNVQIMVFQGINSTINVVTGMLALASYKALSTVAINSLTQKIFPSVLTWDNNIKKACDALGGVPREIFFQLTFLVFCISVACIPLIYAAIGAVIVPIAKFIDDTVRTLMGIDKVNLHCPECSPEPPKTEDVKLYAKTCSNVAAIVIHAAYTILSILCIPFIAPVYVFASAFDLANKFNIYDYNKEYSSGVVHKRLKDIQSCDTALTVNDQPLYLEILSGHPSMSAKFKLAATDSGKPGGAVTSAIAVSVAQVQPDFLDK